MVYKWVLFGVTVLLLVIMVSCGGGFDTDNENTAIFEKTIFGPDTIPIDSLWEN